MEIKVLGPGCTNCKKLLSVVKEAVQELSVDAEVLYVTDMTEIMQAGIMRTPALIVNGRVKLMGRVPSIKEIKQIINGEM